MMSTTKLDNGLVLLAVVAGGVAIAYAARAHRSTPYDALFVRKARERSVPLSLLQAIAKVESGFNPRALNPLPNAPTVGGGVGRYRDGSRDVGLMQVNTKNGARYGFTDAQLLDPAVSVECASRLLSEMRSTLQRAGRFSVYTWPAAYNVGPDLEPALIGEAYAAKVLYHQQLFEWGRLFA